MRRHEDEVGVVVGDSAPGVGAACNTLLRAGPVGLGETGNASSTPDRLHIG